MFLRTKSPSWRDEDLVSEQHMVVMLREGHRRRPELVVNSVIAKCAHVPAPNDFLLSLDDYLYTLFWGMFDFVLLFYNISFSKAFLFLPFFLGGGYRACNSRWKFLGQGSIPCQSSNQSHSIDNAGSSTL